MNLQYQFTRYVGGGSPALGSDGSTSSPPSDTIPVATKDIFFSFPMESIAGFPTTKLVVALSVLPYPGSPGSSVASLGVWLFDYNLGLWVNATGTLTTIGNNQYKGYYVSPLISPPRASGDAAPTAGNIDGYVIAGTNGGAAPAGQYNFAIGASLTESF